MAGAINYPIKLTNKWIYKKHSQRQTKNNIYVSKTVDKTVKAIVFSLLINAIIDFCIKANLKFILITSTLNFTFELLIKNEQL